MTNHIEVLVLFVAGLLCVTAIDTIGSITSRKWKYNYAYLSVLSFMVYAAIGYAGHRLSIGQQWSLITAALVGVYDASVGWKISVALKANWGRLKQQVENEKLSNQVFVMILIGVVLSFGGYALSEWLA